MSNEWDCAIEPLKAGFYWVKIRLGARWEPAEYDGIAWLIGDGTGSDLYLVGPKICEPTY